MARPAAQGTGPITDVSVHPIAQLYDADVAGRAAGISFMTGEPCETEPEDQDWLYCSEAALSQQESKSHMFDLFRSRDRAVRIMLGALLMLVALSMVITLIPGFGSTVGQRGEDVVAEVGDYTITGMMLRRSIQNQMQQNRLPRDLVDIFVPQMLERMVHELATVYEAERMGFRVSHDEIATAIRAMIPQLFAGGQFAGPEVYQQFLSQNNTTIPEFEENVRRQVLVGKLWNIAHEGVIVTPKEVAEEYQKRGEKARLDYVAFQAQDFRAKVSPSRAEMEAYLTANASRFQTPQQRAFTILAADEQKLGEAIEIPETQLRQMYQSQIDRFRVEERVHARHILIKTSAGDAAGKTKAKEKIDGLLKQLRAGGNFEELAKKNSEDPGSAVKGGDLGWITRGQTVKNFEQAAFSLKPKQISDVIETEYGFHILEVLEKEAGRLKLFDEVKNDLLADARRQQVFEKMPSIAEQAQAELAKNPGAAEEIARRLNLSIAKAEKAGPGDPLPLVGVSNELEGALASLQKGGVTPVVQTGNKLVFALVNDVFPPRTPPLSEVEAKVRDAVVGERAQKLAEDKAKEFDAKLRANQNDLTKTARELGLAVTTTTDFDRTANIKGIGQVALLGDTPFTQPVGHVVSNARLGGGIYFYRIAARIPADMARLDAERANIVAIVKERKLQERRDLFSDSLVETLRRQGKLKIHDDAVKRITSSYKS